MLEQQFVQFTANPQSDNQPIMPFVTGSTGLEFYTPDPLTNYELVGVTISLTTPDGGATYASAVTQPTSNHLTIGAETGGIMPKATILAAMGYGSLFRIKYRYSISQMGIVSFVLKYSQVFMLTENADNRLALLRYRCGSTTGGIPYQGGNYVSAWMPIWLDKPQFKQDSEIYTKLDGSTAVLFATATKEYEAQTDYIPVEWHEKILNALMSDDVYINQEKLQKSENYEIKWDKVQTIDNTIKLTKAEWKMKACALTRNTNS